MFYCGIYLLVFRFKDYLEDLKCLAKPEPEKAFQKCKDEAFKDIYDCEKINLFYECMSNSMAAACGPAAGTFMAEAFYHTVVPIVNSLHKCEL